jgi:hypothetical protein
MLSPLLPMRATCLAHLTLLYLIILQAIELLIMQFPPTFYYFYPLGLKRSISTLFSSALSLFPPLNVRGKVLHPYRTKGKIIIFNLLSLF